MNRRKKSRNELAYEFFVRAEQEALLLQYSSIQQHTEYEISTIRKYASRQWSWFLIPQKSGGYHVRGLLTCPLEEFLQRSKLGLLSSSGRLIVYLPTPLAQWIQEWAALEGKDIHEIVIEALERYQRSIQAH